jgi:hypothetical protein
MYRRSNEERRRGRQEFGRRHRDGDERRLGKNSNEEPEKGGSIDAIEVSGRYLRNSRTRERFLLRGIAFPIPPPPHRISAAARNGDADGDDDEDDDFVTSSSYDYTQSYYHAEGWIAVLEQLAADLEINAVRVYDMDCRIDYSLFLNRAAELGVYVIVPFTAVRGSGVLDRNGLPPSGCYPASLYRYGRTCVDNFGRYPNVLAGTIGNEVMNSLLTWSAAPCVRAYARDLKSYMKRKIAKEQKQFSSSLASDIGTTASQPSTYYRVLPLLYAAQHDSPDASVLPEIAMTLTADYLTCVDKDEEDGDGNNDSGRTNHSISAVPPGGEPIDNESPNHSDRMAARGAPAGRQQRGLGASRDVDMYGINVESWCSSLQTFETNEDGSESGYHALFRAFKNASFPVVFTETGCSKSLFNRDNGLLPRGERDWKQIPIILNRMADVLSGFSAYAYDGNPLFRMMDSQGAPWDGVHVLSPSQDYENFRTQLHLSNQQLASSERRDDGDSIAFHESGSKLASSLLSCSEASADLKNAWKVDLVPLTAIPSYVDLVPDDEPVIVNKRPLPPSSPAAGAGIPNPDHQEVFPGPGGLSGIRASLAVMLAGVALGLWHWLSQTTRCCAFCCCCRRRRQNRLRRRTSSNRSASSASQDGGPDQQVSLLERSEDRSGAGSVPTYGTLTPDR